MAGRQVKGGYLLRHKRRLLGPNVWREQWVVLLEDSTLAWYKDNGSVYPEGVLRVRDCPELLAVSQWTLRIPGRPRLPQGCGVLQLLAIGQGKAKTSSGTGSGTGHPPKLRKVHWMLSRSQQECHEWMTAISLTLPPLPPPRTPSFKSSSGRRRNANDSCSDSADGVVDLPTGLLTGSGVHNWQNSQAHSQAQAQLLQWGGWGQGGGYVVSDPCGHHGHMHTASSAASGASGASAQPAYSWHDQHASLAATAHHDCTGIEAMHTDMDIGDLGDLSVGMDCLGDFSF